MPELTHNTNLRDMLNLNNNNSSNSGSNNAILNQKFARWKSLVDERLVTTPAFKNDSQRSEYRKYLRNPDCELFEEAQAHALAYNKPIQAENIIALTHPFHLHLSNTSELDTPLKRREADHYLNKLLGLLELNLPKEKVGIVVLECLYHYAAATSLLLESGLIDRVVFTEAHSGEIKTTFEFDPTFTGKQIFVGGGYNFNSDYENGCLAGTNKYLKGKAKSLDHFWAIQDLILNHPYSFDWFIKPEKILIGSMYKKFPQSRVISLEETLQKIGCQPRVH